MGWRWMLPTWDALDCGCGHGCFQTGCTPNIDVSRGAGTFSEAGEPGWAANAEDTRGSNCASAARMLAQETKP